MELGCTIVHFCSLLYSCAEGLQINAQELLLKCVNPTYFEKGSY